MESKIKNAETDFLEVGEIGYSDTLCNRVECVEDKNTNVCDDCCFDGNCYNMDIGLCTPSFRPDNKNVYFKISLK